MALVSASKPSRISETWRWSFAYYFYIYEEITLLF